jgi:dTMP kinase
MSNREKSEMIRLVSKGFFICLEGLDGCGKTTQAKLLVRNLKKKGSALYTAEPSNSHMGKFTKEHCLHTEKRHSAVVEALLFAADRFEHVENTILPALKDSQTVVSDRYVYSSLAYQGSAGLDLKWISKINSYAIRPDLAIFIDVEPETVVQRLKPRKSVMEDIETQRKVRSIYCKFVEKGALTRINGNKPEREVTKEILAVVKDFLKNH